MKYNTYISERSAQDQPVNRGSQGRLNTSRSLQYLQRKFLSKEKIECNVFKSLPKVFQSQKACLHILRLPLFSTESLGQSLLRRLYLRLLLCFLDTGVCHPNPCRNGGSCFKSRYSFNCKCTRGYKGKHCELSELLRFVNVITFFPTSLCKRHVQTRKPN